MLQVTQVRIFPTKNAESNIKAFASVTLGDDSGEKLAIRNIRVVSGANGLFVAMPSDIVEKDGEKKFKDVVFPVNAEARKLIQDSILAEYEATVQE